MKVRALLTSLLALATLVILAGCEPRLPLAYLRESVRPERGMAATERITEETEVGLEHDLPPPVPLDWDEIARRDTLKALLTFNSTGYFIHKGEPLGYEYELLQAFAAEHGLALETVVVRDRLLLFRMLNAGEGDVVAARLVAAPEYLEAVALTQPLYTTPPVVVQKRPETPPVAHSADPDSVPPTPVEAELPDSLILSARLLARPGELAGEEIYVPRGFDYYDRIVEISDSMGQSIELIEVRRAEQVEPLIEAVAEGRIRLTVSQENLVELSMARFQNIVATPVLGPEAAVVWAVRRNAPTLLQVLNTWLESPEASALREQLYLKYYIDRKGYVQRVEDDLFASETGHISRYDSLLTRHASGIGWDWRLLAAQVAQESRFDPSARSWAGARGLLQLMPRTAREMGVRNPNDPEQSIRGGVRYLEWLSGLWEDEVPDAEERVKFILASYNAGRGHVLDAQRLAKKHGADPTRWDDVAYWLLQKSKPAVYRDPVVEHGYVRGLEPVQYVSRILERFDRYREIGPE